MVAFSPQQLSPRNEALSFVKLISSTISVFQIKQVALSWDLNRLEAVVLNRTRKKGDSTTFDIRKCFQCSGGKSWYVLSLSHLATTVLAALGLCRNSQR
jgi:hypothetical protein